MSNKRRKVRRKIRIKQSARLVQKNDATRVAKTGVDTIPRMRPQMPRTNGAVLKVKIKQK